MEKLFTKIFKTFSFVTLANIRLKKSLTLTCLLVFSFTLFPISLLHAADSIVAVDVEGLDKSDKVTALKAIQLKAGDPYSLEAVNRDLKSLYALGIFTDIEVDKVNAGSGVKIIFRVKERPIVTKITIQGSKTVGNDKLNEAIVQKEQQPLDEKKIGESKENIKEAYAKEGLGLAVVSTEVKSLSGKDDVELIFKISENKNLKVKKITFEGNTVFSNRKLRSFMATKEKGFLSFLTGSGKYRDEMIERDTAFITYQYLNRGYLKVQVEKPEIIPLAKGDGIEVHYKITEGDRYKIRNVSLQGNILTTKQELLSRFTTLKGNYYSQKLLEDDIAQITELYGNQGYAFANIRPQPNPDDATKEVDINILIDKGDKIAVEKINITGNTITRDKVLRRELKITENSFYNEALVQQSKKRLEALGYFEKVEISTPKGSGDDKLNLNINVKEKPTGSFSVGAGYSSVESFLVTASISKQNFMGLGISGSVLAEISKLRQQFSLQYSDPYFLDSKWIFSGNVSKLLTRYDDFDRDALGGEVDFGRHLFEHSSATLGYRLEKVKVDNFSLVVPQFFQNDTSGVTSSAVLGLERDTRNNRLAATKGDYNQVVLEYAGLGGSNQFFRVNANSRFFLPIPFPKNSVLKANLRLGYIKSFDGPVPLFERYFTGGVNSLRGFTPRTIGPKVQIPPGTTDGDQTFVYGGDKLLVFNLEYEFPIYDPANIRGVVFVDAGNAYAENQDLNPLQVRTDWGFGVRWVSPFGPLRFEWGIPFKRQPGEDKIVFNFTIGTFF